MNQRGIIFIAIFRQPQTKKVTENLGKYFELNKKSRPTNDHIEIDSRTKNSDPKLIVECRPKIQP